MKNLALVGFMGTGKSTVGRLVAEKMLLPFIDLDELIEQTEQLTIPEIFRQKGEHFFRLREKQMLRQACSGTGRIIACGGGAVLDPENLRQLKETCVSVCLRASPETILARTGEAGRRPLLDTEDKAGRVRDLLTARDKCYAQADFQLDTDGRTPQEIAERIIELAAERM